MTDTTAPAPETAAAVALEAPVSAPGGPAWAVGRRKKATDRVRIRAGEGKITVNGRPLDTYFLSLRDQNEAVGPLEAMGVRNRYDFVIKVAGGGSTGQSGAVALGIARGLIKCDPAFGPRLRQAGLVTRDARIKARKKYGRRGARRGFQFSKR